MGTQRLDDGDLNVRTPWTLPPKESLEALGITGALALINNAISHLINPIHNIPRSLPILERIAVAIEESRDLLENIISLPDDGGVRRHAVRSVALQSNGLKEPFHLEPIPVAVVD